MISYPGYESLIKRVYESRQEHVFAAWESLSDEQKKLLLDDLSDINFDQLSTLFEMTDKVQDAELPYGPAQYIRVPVNEEQTKAFSEAHLAGEEAIRKGKCCAFVVAGGQGTRLGYDGPKGAYNVSPVKNKSLFQIHSEKILKSSKKYGVRIPFLIMTSQLNYDATRLHFEENNYFGLDPESVIMFKQGMIPSLDISGKLILSSPSSVFKNPDGHGGSLTALEDNGILDRLQSEGIEFISYFQVDNPLVRIIDPVFIGFHVLHNAKISSKAITKAYPEEKVGNFVAFQNGTSGVVEYSDLPEEKAFLKNKDGSLVYSAGSIAIHIFSVSFVKSITSGASLSLPFHLARKSIKSWVNGSISEINGFKFEKFVFDALPLTQDNIILETLRSEEFAPVKNKSGIDSVDSSKQLMSDLFRSWFEKRGIDIPLLVQTIEISPLFALGPEDIPADYKLENKPVVYVE